MKEKGRLFTVILIAFAVLSLVFIDAREIKKLNGDEISSYWVKNDGQQIKNVKEGKILTRFYPVSDHLETLELKINAPKSGIIKYKIRDKDNKVIKSKKIAVDGKENNGIVSLDVSDVEFKAGQKYIFTTSFYFKTKVEVTIDYQGIQHEQTFKENTDTARLIFLIIINLAIAGIIFAVIKWEDNNYVFLGITIIMGIFVIIMSSPYSREDEFRHFVRAYDLCYGGDNSKYCVPDVYATGQMVLDKNGCATVIDIPKELSDLRLVSHDENFNTKTYYAEINQKLCITKLKSVFANPEEDKLAQVSEEATVGRGIESYFPQVLAMFVARLFNLRSGYYYYIACFGQLIVASAMIFLAAKLAGRYNIAIWFSALIPSAVMLRSSANPDGIMLAEVLLGVAIILNLREKEIKLNTVYGITSLIGVAVLLLLVFKMKPPYTVVILASLLMLKKENISFINRENLKKNKWVIPVVSVLAVMVIAVIAVKYEVIRAYFHIFLPQAHIDYIFDNFHEVVVLFLISGYRLLFESIKAMGGDILKYWLVFLIAMLLIKRNEKVWLKVYLVFMFFVMLGIIVLAGYTLTPPDYGYIWGITYRYLLPAWPLLALALPVGNEKTEECVRKLYPAFICVVGFSDILTNCQIY